jgi:signal transduction histidine kinase
MGSLARQSSDLHRLQVDVSDHRQRERWAEARHEERLHEVRNVLAGLHGATATLRRYEDRLDLGVRRRLEDAVSGELHRLAHLLDPSPAEALVPLALDDALAPVLVSERHQGAVLRADLRGVRVMARPADLATVVSALLVNARRHAPGSPVSLSAQRRDDEVRILVEDAGPGVPLHLRQAVFERGERGSATAPGSGLGLYTARQLAESMGGTLHVESRGGPGARFVLTLASTTSATVPLQGAQRAPQTGEVDDRAGRVAAAVPAQRQDGAGADLDLAARRHDRDLAGDA